MSRIRGPNKVAKRHRSDCTGKEHWQTAITVTTKKDFYFRRTRENLTDLKTVKRLPKEKRRENFLAFITMKGM
jgi:hypothetical protein